MKTGGRLEKRRRNMKAFNFNGSGGNFFLAKRRRDLTMLIYEIFPRLNGMLKAFRNQHDWYPIDNSKIDVFIKRALSLQILLKNGGSYEPYDEDARRYLLGSWLEEFVALAFWKNGLSDIRFSQEIFWRAKSDGSAYKNEIDVMATANDKLILVSCKAVAEDTLDRRKGEDRIFDALQELSYWNAHFASGEGLPVFVTTADFYDEKLRSFRSPRLVERANVMGIKVLPADFGTFDVFTEKVAQLIDG